MARRFLTPIDLNQLELQNAVIQVLGSDPGSPVQGQLWYNSASKTLKFYTGTTTIVLGRLDQLTAPTGSVSLGSQLITNLATPVSTSDAANKSYVDATAAGIDWKASVRVATTANGTLASAFANGQTVDGIALVTGDRILLKNQTTGSENGIYVVAASGAPTRATDADANAEVTAGLAVFVEEGTTNADSGWVMTNDGAVVVGTTALVFTQFTGIGSLVAGAGLTKTGTTVDVGAGTGISVGADSVAVDTAVVVRKYAVDVGDGASTTITVTHNLGTVDVIVSVYDKTTPFQQVEVDARMTTTNTVTLIFAVAPTSAQYRCVVHG